MLFEIATSDCSLVGVVFLNSRKCSRILKNLPFLLPYFFLLYHYSTCKTNDPNKLKQCVKLCFAYLLMYFFGIYQRIK
jgi:uncharacterized membrane protein (GlpM family)